MSVFILLFGFILYILPAFIAFSRNHKNAMAIAVLDLLAGWTFVGWVAALIWSLMADQSTFQGGAKGDSGAELKQP